jgi:hypothetical protein
MWYIVLMAAFKGDNEAIPILNWEDLTEDQQVDLLNDHSEIVGMHCAGAYCANNINEAIQQAEENANEWEGGCVA